MAESYPIEIKKKNFEISFMGYTTKDCKLEIFQGICKDLTTSKVHLESEHPVFIIKIRGS